MPTTPRTDITGFLKLVFEEVGTIPRQGLIYMGLAALTSIGMAAAIRLTGSGFQLPDYAIVSANGLCWIGVIYVVTMLMVGKRQSWIGFGKYVLTGLVVGAPLLSAIGALIAFASLGFSAAALVSGLLILPAMLPLLLLPGWPLWQAVSDRVISPLEAWRSTRGFRWPLFISAFVIVAFDRLVPTGSQTLALESAIIIAFFSAIVSLAKMAFSMGIAVSAMRLMESANGTK